MSTVLEAVREFAGLSGPPAGAADFLLPAAEHDELRAHRLRRQIEDKRQELRDARARLVAADRAVAAAQEPLDRALAAIAAVEPALERARVAREADTQARRAALEHGGQYNSSLAEAAEAALRDVREARRAQAAAKDALPGLQQRVEAAESAVKDAQSGIEGAIFAVIVATLAQRVQDAHALAARLNACYRELGAVSELFLRGRSFGLPTGSVPDDLVPLVEMAFTPEELLAGMRPWREFARRLREDPDANFE